MCKLWVDTAKGKQSQLADKLGELGKDTGGI